MPRRVYTQKQVDRMVSAAIKFIEGRIAGAQTVKVGRVTHNPNQGGMCARFIRECVEAGMGWPEYTWDMAGASANETRAKLNAAGYSIGDTSFVRPGDLLWRPGGPHGHIGMYLGTNVPGHETVPLIGENTSSGKRGFPRAPGTKYTRRGLTRDGRFGNWREVFRLTKPL